MLPGMQAGVSILELLQQHKERAAQEKQSRHGGSRLGFQLLPRSSEAVRKEKYS